MTNEMLKNNHVLITGMQRSGTTFTAQILRNSGAFTYLPEPFNPDYGIEGVDSHYSWLDLENRDDKNKLLLHKLFTYNARFKKNYERDSIIKKTAKYILGTKAERRYKLQGLFNKKKCRFLIKDPDAVFLSEYIAQNFNCQVLFIIRHPCAVLASYKRLEWDIDFHPIMKMDLIHDNPILSYTPKIKNDKITLIEKVAILWVIINKKLSLYARRNTDWMMIRHEDLCRTPDSTFKEIYDWADLKYTPKIRKNIYNMTNTDNPVKARNNRLHDFSRNSEKLVDSWKREIEDKERAVIRNITEPVSSLYYDDQSWE